ncbi:MAG: hypothetical protein RJA63_865 [Pseudomonadota bacterium]|jgi:plasmid stabilization system protein ParE
MDDEEHSLDLYWHALNYRTAGPLQAEQMWQELRDCVDRIARPENYWTALTNEQVRQLLDNMPLAHKA